MPLPEPTIKITLTGLLILYFKPDPADSTKLIECQVGVHSVGESRQHGLRITVHKTAQDDAETPASSVILELARQLQGADIRLKVEAPHPDAEGVILFPQAAGPVTVGSIKDVSPFDLIPDIEGTDFHKGKVTIKPTTLSQILRFNNGVFYTAKKRDGFVLRGKGPVNRFGNIGIDVGINIYLQNTPDSKATLKWGSRPDQFMEFTKAANTLYVIDIRNDRLAPIDNHDDSVLHENDFKLYYEVLDVPDSLDQFGMVFPKMTGSPVDKDHPCGSIRGSVTQQIKP